MSQNPQINTPTENNQTFYSDGSQQVIQPNQYSYDNTTTTSDNFLYGTTLMTCVDSTSQNYPTMSYSNYANTEQVSTQNLSQSAMNTYSSLPPYMATPSEIISFEIPGYDVIYIPKSYQFVNSNVNLNIQQHDINFLNPSPLEPQSYISNCVSGISVGESPTNAINTHDNHVIPQNQQQISQESFNNFNNLHGY